MTTLKRFLGFFVFIIVQMILLTSCPLNSNSGVDTPEIEDLVTTDGTVVFVDSPVALSITEVDPASAPAGAVSSVVDITGSLGAGQTAQISFTSDTAFSSSNCVAYYDTGWIPVVSFLSPDGLLQQPLIISHFGV